MHDALTLLSGGLVGFSLGLVGGGGSVLAVPLLVYVVGVSSPHVAIGTSAVAVTASAALSLWSHTRLDHVKWRCALVFALAGVVGTALGAALGKVVEGQSLLMLFGGLMIVVGTLMLRPRRSGEDPHVRLTEDTARRLLPALVGTGFGVGLLSGFFGIGGGFLIVPGLVGATQMPLLFAIGSSLVSVTAFGATTAVSYALSGYVDWPVAGLFVLGGAAGGAAGLWLGGRLAAKKRALLVTFSAIVISAGLYVLARGLLT